MANDEWRQIWTLFTFSLSPRPFLDQFDQIKNRCRLNQPIRTSWTCSTFVRYSLGCFLKTLLNFGKIDPEAAEGVADKGKKCQNLSAPGLSLSL